MISLIILWLSVAQSTVHTVATTTNATNNGSVYILNFDQDDEGNPLVAGTIDFAAVQPYANLYGPGSGVTFSTDNPSTLPLNLYDSEGNTAEDPDLERNGEGTGVWEGGNLTSEPLYNLLIINKNTAIDVPNDNGGGGEINMVSDRMLQSFFFSFVDLDDGRVASSTIVFNNTITNETATISFSDLEENSGTVYATPNVDFGDRHGNQVQPVTAAQLGITGFNQVRFLQTGSGGIGSVMVETASVVCAPVICAPIDVEIRRTEP